MIGDLACNSPFGLMCLHFKFRPEEGMRKIQQERIKYRLLLTNCQNSIEAYEHKHYPISAANPVEAIKFRMEQQGRTQKDLEPFIGSSGRVSEVLNHKRRLSLQMVKRLHDGLHIPYESLLSAT